MSDSGVSRNVKENAHPLLSILVPAYCYPVGVARIMDGLLPQLISQPSKIEVLIFDDSPDAGVESVVGNHSQELGVQHVVYQHNRPAKGAVDNWNSLLDAARGDYCLLMHHDEFPVGSTFVNDIVNELLSNPTLDVLLLDCFLVNSKNNHSNRHLPMWLRAFVIRNFPEYLFRRNVIGPTSAIVIRRTLYPRFNGQLRWLVDVDLYFRALKTATNIGISCSIKIGSILGRPDSITAKLGSRINYIKNAEYDYLRKLYGKEIIWLDMQWTKLTFASALGIFESVFWGCFRILNRAANMVGLNSVPMAKPR